MRYCIGTVYRRRWPRDYARRWLWVRHARSFVSSSKTKSCQFCLVTSICKPTRFCVLSFAVPSFDFAFHFRYQSHAPVWNPIFQQKHQAATSLVVARATETAGKVLPLLGLRLEIVNRMLTFVWRNHVEWYDSRINFFSSKYCRARFSDNDSSNVRSSFFRAMGLQSCRHRLLHLISQAVVRCT